MRCADCGVEVERSPNGHWAELREGFGLRVWRVACRRVMDDDRLVSADYHYVEGEVQRHWPVDTVSTPHHGLTFSDTPADPADYLPPRPQRGTT